MEYAKDFLHYTIRAGETLAQGVDSWDFSVRAGLNEGHATKREFTFIHADLPKSFDLGPTNIFSRSADGTRQEVSQWRGKWEIWIERGAAETSVLDGTSLFFAWKTLYQADELIELCDRILVLARGSVTRRLSRPEFSRSAILTAAMGDAA